MRSSWKLLVHEMRQRCRRLNAANLETCCDDVVMLTCVMETPSSVCVLSGQDDATEKIMEDSLFIQSATVNEVPMLNCAMDTSSSVCVPNGPPLEFYLVSESSCVALAGSENSPPDVFELKGKLLEFLRCTGKGRLVRVNTAQFDPQQLVSERWHAR